ncbi:hypothetical protein [uncultured Shimia sp.]|uniref:hypothetical protein n=1 Tax=uncultured Shimia sp. TaxID=573152 RepID=UPI00262D29B1|nr:hypothetical protein [uncultured Shimia sp.]
MSEYPNEPRLIVDPCVIVPEDLLKPSVCEPQAAQALQSMARTEDIRFSKDGKMLAVLGFAKQSIAMFEIDWTNDQACKGMRIKRHVSIVSDSFVNPHGIDFIYDKRFVVASRSGGAEVYELPTNVPWGNTMPLMPTAVIDKISEDDAVHTPGSVAVIPEEGGSV